MAVKENLPRIFGDIFIGVVASRYKVGKYLKKNYNTNPDRSKNIPSRIIYMADGRMHHGGMVDRIRGIISIYDYCKRNNIDFRINFVSPFRLEEILKPNIYQWTIDPQEIIYDKRISKPVYIMNCVRNPQGLVNRLLNKKYLQYHVYTNITVNESTLASNYQELFKPSHSLQQEIDSNLQSIGDKYISATFRFQQLLGDFEEGNFKILEPSKREELISKCLEAIKRIKKNNYDIEKILVTADSSTFLERVKCLDYVYVIPGDMKHMDFTSADDQMVYLKSFIDFHMLINSLKVYFIYSDNMYAGSRFASTAALIGKSPYISLKV